LAHAIPHGAGRTGPGGGGATPGHADGQGAGLGTPGGNGNGGGGLGTGDGNGQAARAGTSGPGGSSADLFRIIRRKIEEAKLYPDSARRSGLQGTVEMVFRIGPDGSPQGLEVVRSSGHAELDRVSLETIRRAAPYPAVQGRIRIPLSYRLD